MKIVSSLNRLLAWLREPVPVADWRLPRLPWWDLPPHHPCR